MMKRGCLVKTLSITIAFTFIFGALVGGDLTPDEINMNGKLDPDLSGASGVIDLRIDLQRDADTNKITDILERIGVQINRINTVSVNYLETTVNANLINQISAMDEVTWMQRMYEPQTLMDLIQTNTFMGQDTPQANGFTGSGILAEVVDNGIDLTHTDLGQVQYTDFTVFPDDHGTCTTGIMFGDGTGDMNAQGIMYEATGVFADWNNGNALSIQNLWDGTFTSGNAGQNGVVQTNSWWNGAFLDGQYDAKSNEIDQAIVDNPKVLVHWAIGNSNDGEAEGQMIAESMAKNTMSVGAIFHKNTATTTDDDWHSVFPGSTPSRGPAADGRVKPDMCATFDLIYTTDMMGGAGYSSGNYYTNMGGTSGATPTVAGSSGLVYEMYQENFFDNNPTAELPYSSTIKALMIADAYQYPMNANQITRNVQGWGTPDMENMYNLGPNNHVIEEYPQALAGGESWSREVFSDGINPLKFTVAWVEPAAPSSTLSGRALFNNLDLHVTSPSGTQYWGNNGLGSALWSSPGTLAQRWSTTSSYRDDLNNVENVFIQSPEVGVWIVEVLGRTGDLLQGPQDFSMVASGAKGVSSMGTVNLEKAVYILEDTALITVSDLDLDTNPGTIQNVIINIVSTTEPAGENVLLTETEVNSAVFKNTITLSATNGVGILQISEGDTITATYIDADYGGTGPAVLTDNASVDGVPPQPPTGLTVVWDDSPVTTLIYEDFEDAMGPEWTTYESTPAFARNQRDTYDAAAGLYSWRMDVTTDNNYNLNELILTLDASLYDQLDLYFSTRHLGEEQDPMSPTFFDHEDSDGVAVSTDGVNWERLWTIQFTNVFATFGPLDIDAVIPLTGTIYIKFQQYDNYAMPTDGTLWDEILINGTRIDGTGTADNRLDWVISTDDGAGDNDVDHYNIYRADNPAGPWVPGAVINTVPAGITNYTDLDRGEFDGTTWWYVVRAEDTSGNVEQNTIAIPEPNGVIPEFLIPVSAGWNFVSTPLIPGDTTVPGVFNDIDSDTSWTVLQHYDSDTTDHWKSYMTFIQVIADLADVDEKKGVWIFVTVVGDGFINVSGAQPFSTTVDLQPGWNMVGFPSQTEGYTVGDLKSDSGGVVTMVENYNSTALYNIEVMPDGAQFLRGSGYWVYSTSAYSWIIP